MRLVIMSDLHMECSPRVVIDDWLREYGDVLVLAGDIHAHTHGLAWARAEWPDKPIIYVAGNHELDGAHIDGLIAQLRLRAEALGIHFLENDDVVIGGVRFLGCLLWSDFGLFGHELIGQAMAQAGKSMPEYKLIYGSGGKLLTPRDTLRLHRISRAWLEQQLAAKTSARKTVVVTHHAPVWASVVAKFQHDILSAAFASRLDTLVEKADLWIHGHVHGAVNYTIDGCRVCCNPRGYGDERPEFEPLLVEI